MTPTQLLASVSAFAARGDLDAMMPTFLELAEHRIYQGDGETPGLRLTSMLSLGNMAGSGFTQTLPLNFLGMKSVYIIVNGQYILLEYKAKEQVFPYFGQSGLPKFWSFNNSGEFVIAPPRGSTVGYFDYYEKPATPVSDSVTNAVLRDYAPVYLYAMLIEVANYLRDDTMVAQYVPQYRNAMANAQRADDEKRIGYGPLTMTASAYGVRV